MNTRSSSRSTSTTSASRKTTRKAVRARGQVGSKAIDAPFDPTVLRRARKVADTYSLRFEPSGDGYIGTVVEMPGVLGVGNSIESSAKETVELLVSALATLIEMGEPIPSPASAAKRDRQVNIRLTADEKLRLEDAARAAGFRSVSDYLRTAGLERAG